MKALIIESTEKTPHVVLDPANNSFVIGGMSVPKDAEAFYNPILEWLEEYSKTPNESTVLKFEFNFFNISSSKRILYILYRMEEMFERGCDVSVHWCYSKDNEDMYEVGQDYAFMVKLPFEFKCVPAVSQKSNNFDLV